jgi:hypothetical protein
MLPASLPLPVSPERIAFLTAFSALEDDYEAAIMQARQYDQGEQFVALTERLREFLGGDTANDSEDWKRLRLNICHIILSAVVDRLIVSGFDTEEVPQEQPAIDENGQPTTRLVKPVAAWAWRTWQRNRMDAKQRRVHEATLRDSEAFVIVDWDNTAQRARFTPHNRFVDGSNGGDGEGCVAFYRNDDPDQDLMFILKRWTEVMPSLEGGRNTRQRLTVYLPNEIRKYAGYPGAWSPTQDSDDEPWPIPWTTNQQPGGPPLGIPVAHGRSSAGMEAREAWPIQNLINKALVDLATESDMAAFRILVALGWEPVVAGSKTPANPSGTPLSITPGTWIGTAKDTAKVQEIAGADLSQFLNVIESLMFWAATVTDTPISRFITTKQVSSEEAQKEQNGALNIKTRNRAGELGNMWEDCMSIARRLENTFGVGGLDESVELFTQWQPLEARDTTKELTEAGLKKALGMPIRLIAKGLDLTQEDIALWEEDAQQAQAQAQARFDAEMRAKQPVATVKTVQRDTNGRVAGIIESQG